MFINLFQSIFMAIMPIVVLGGAGFVLFRRKVLDDHTLGALSVVLVNLFLPALIFHRFINNFEFSQFPLWWAYPFLGFGIVGVGFLFSCAVFAPFKELKHKEQLMALITFQNSGYIPLLLVSSLFSGAQQQALFVKIFLLVVGFSLSIWSLGVRLLTEQAGRKAYIKTMLNTPFVMTFVSIAIVYSGWHKHVPYIINEPARLLGGCALPVAMIIVGGNLAHASVKNIISPALSWTIFIKLILLPALALGLVLALRLEFFLGFLILLEFAVPSALTLSIICRHFNAQEKYINHGLLLGHVLSIVTIPFFLALYFKMTGGY